MHYSKRLFLLVSENIVVSKEKTETKEMDTSVQATIIWSSPIFLFVLIIYCIVQCIPIQCILYCLIKPFVTSYREEQTKTNKEELELVPKVIKE